MTVRYDIMDRVAVITIDRPERRNSVDLATAEALLDAWRRFDADAAADVAVLYGAGGTFSAGADLKAFDLVDRPEGYLGFTRLEVSKPTIAAVEGFCVAGGLEMALWCDIRVTGRSAMFGCFERRFGVPLVDGGTQRLPRIVGHGVAMEMILTGRVVDAEEAYAIGLSNLVVADGSALEAAMRIGRTIAGFPQETVRSDRRAVLEGADLPIEQGLAVERRYGSRVMDTAREGAERFAAGEGRAGRRLRPAPEHPTARPTWSNITAPVVGGPLELRVDDRTVPMHVARPDAPGRAVLVIHDRWGFDHHARAVADRLAEAGFVAAAVGLVDPTGHGNIADADKKIDTLEEDETARILSGAVQMLRSLPGSSGRVGVVGFGVGGGLAMWVAASEPSLRACVAYGPTSPWSGVTPDFTAPHTAFLGHYGAFDDRASPHTAYQLEMRLREVGIDATFETYRRAGSEFYRSDDPARFHEQATELAWSRTIGFLDRAL
ncbi:MAG: crotonase/enoyl-CoA hydratase family protein [Acidimicrobiia bacterium]